MFGRQSNRLNNYLYKRFQVISLVNFAYVIKESFLCSVGRASLYNRVKKDQLDAQLILSIFLQLLHVSGVLRPIVRRYNRMYTTFGIYYSF